MRAVEDVAVALGYANGWAYNSACEREPAEVQARIDAL